MKKAVTTTPAARHNPSSRETRKTALAVPLPKKIATMDRRMNTPMVAAVSINRLELESRETNGFKHRTNLFLVDSKQDSVIIFNSILMDLIPSKNRDKG